MDTTQDQPVGLGVKGLGHCSFVGDEEKPVTSGNFGCFRKHRGLNSRNGEWSQKTGIFFDSINFNLMMFGSSDPTKRQDKTMVLERQSKDLGRLVRWRQKIVSVFSQKGRHPTRSLIISLRAFLANQSKVCPCFMQDDAKMQNLMVVADGGHIRKNLGCIFIRYGSVRLTWCVTGFPINSWNPQLTFLGYFWLPNFGHFWILTLDGWVMLQITKLICRSSHLDPQILRNLTVIMFGCEFQLILMSLSFLLATRIRCLKKKKCRCEILQLCCEVSHCLLRWGPPYFCPTPIHLADLALGMPHSTTPVVAGAFWRNERLQEGKGGGPGATKNGGNPGGKPVQPGVYKIGDYYMGYIEDTIWVNLSIERGKL